MGFYKNDATPTNNTSINGIAIQGGSSPANIDNALRELSAQGKQFVLDISGATTVGGTADAIAITANDTAVNAYFDGMIIGFVAGSDNTTTTPTANVNAIGAKTIKKAIVSTGTETALAAGDIQSGGLYLLRYRSAWASAAGAWQLIDLQHGVSISDLAAWLTATTASQAQAEAGTDNATIMTPLRTAQAIAALAGDVWDYASQAEAEAGADNTALMTPLRTAQAITALAAGGNDWTYETPVNVTAVSAITFTGLTGAKEIEMFLENVNFGAGEGRVRVGDAGGLETTGYQSGSAGNYGTSPNSIGDHTGFALYTPNNGFGRHGAIRLFSAASDDMHWACTHALGASTYGAGSSGGGFKTLSDVLTQVSIGPTTGNFVAGGTVHLRWR